MNIRNYRITFASSYVGYVIQAIVVNFPPLLFVTFIKNYGLSLGAISVLIVMTFAIQLIIDIVSAKILCQKNIRALGMAAQLSSAIGLILLAVLPAIMSNTFAALIISSIIYSAGSGLTEVVISPIVEACPSENKSAAMSLLHSFYCWGSAFTILIATGFFALFGIEKWQILSIILAAVPLLNLIGFAIMPIGKIDHSEESKGSSLKSFNFAVMMIIMLCGGAAEIAISQWASAFAESGLHISKAAGDIAGPCLFAIMMGCGRVLYSLLSEKLQLRKYMTFSAVLCTAGYIIAVASPIPALSLAGIAICGFAVSIFWPGTLSLASARFGAPAAMFGLLAFAGDIGCTIGPSAVGMVSGFFNDNLKAGLMFAIVFPVIMLIGMVLLKKLERNNNV